MSTDIIVHERSDPTTEPNSVYGIMKQGTGLSSYNEQVGVRPMVDPHVTKAVGKPHKISVRSRQSVPLAPPTGRDVGVAREGEEGGVYETIPGDTST